MRRTYTSPDTISHALKLIPEIKSLLDEQAKMCQRSINWIINRYLVDALVRYRQVNFNDIDFYFDSNALEDKISHTKQK